MRYVRALLLLILIAAPLAARELFWPEIRVDARLDARGVLHVTERQTYDFDGDWNGGERTFRLGQYHQFRLDGITRIDDRGQRHDLHRGSLNALDDYQLNDNVLRWRARLPDDPPFHHKRITYEIRYSIGAVLLGVDGVTPEFDDGPLYRLDHEFSFADRAGRIERFELNLEFAPEWQHEPIRITREPLEPEQRVAVDERLNFHGTAKPLTWQMFLLAPPPLVELRSLDVEARLDDAGVLQCNESQELTVAGAWSEATREFVLDENQAIEIVGMQRVQDGARVALREGDGKAADTFRLDGSTLRWSGRSSDDEPMQRTNLRYEIAYRVRNTLIQSDRERYHFTYSFAPASIAANQRTSVALTFAPAWNHDSLRLKATGHPGDTMLVATDLRFGGNLEPAIAWSSTPLRQRRAIGLLLLLGLAALFAWFWVTERTQGRFARYDADIDADWMREHVYSQKPEVVGYMWDAKCGAPEVSATLARMEQDGKIRSSVERRGIFKRAVLQLEQVAESRHFEAQESLLKVLFLMSRGEKTDTDKIRAYYRTTGFNPAAQLEPFLVEAAEANAAWASKGRRMKVAKQKYALITAYVLLVPALIGGSTGLTLALVTALFGGAACAIGRAIAQRSSTKLRLLPLWWTMMSLPLFAAAAIVLRYCFTPVTHASLYSLLATSVFVLIAYRHVLLGARTPESSERLALRQRLAAARRWFMREVRKEQPELEASSLPYLLAFGLGNHVDRWFASFGAAATSSRSHSVNVPLSSDSSSSSGGSIGSSSSIGGSWAGAASSFGGAGATGSWLAATSSLSAPMSAPSSSSGGGSSDSGGSSSSSSSSSSSGGGGGGGW